VSEDVVRHFWQYSRPSRRESANARVVPRLTAYQRTKSVAARVTAALMLFALAPVVLLCAVVVRLTSKGPSFYSQVRLGHRGRLFRIYKLRTMKFRCEAETGAVWATARDPRVTRVGRVLRRLHLDELPQLWNIACGDMCFIGPRPERPEIAEKLLLDIPNFNERLAIRPGLTGLAQVLQMADTSIDSARRKLRLDLDYGRREGIWLDARIVVGTALIIVGVPRGRVEKFLALRSKPVRPPQPAPVSDSIFDSPHDLPKLCDSGILGAL
jgi:lipopolysaccharide/colanic/teichoic acid biosynthesis glycosyltransferase